MSNPLTISTHPRSVYPSRLIQRLQTNDDPKNSFSRCYQISTIYSYIKYFLEISGTSEKEYKNNLDPDFDYGILALYPTGHGKLLLYDLEYDALFPFQTADLDAIDSIIDRYQMVDEIEKSSLIHLVDKYIYSNGFNANEHFDQLLINNLETDKIKEKDTIVDDISHDLPNQ